MTTLTTPAELREPPFARFLFADPRASWLWLIVRLYLGYEWLTSAFGKLGSPAWTGSQAGAAVNGFAQGALAKTGGDHPDVTGWYAWFLQNLVIPNAGLFGWLVTIGELAVGIALIVGALTGIAAFFGAFMNMSFLLAGSASTNPVMFTLAVGLMLAWKVAGYYGVDRYLLPRLGTPWRPGALFMRREGDPATG